MKTKLHYFLTLILLVPMIVPAANYNACVSIQVTNDLGVPLAGVVVNMSMFDHHEAGDGFGEDISRVVSGQTDAQGMVTLTNYSQMPLAYIGVSAPAGHYDTHVPNYEFTSPVDGRWQPWSPILGVAIKPIVAPIALFAKDSGYLKLPTNELAMGYDLQIGDWVAPRGNGTNSDLIFTFHRQFTRPADPFDLSMVVTFANDGDGIQTVDVPKRGSELRLRTAPETGYLTSLTNRVFRLTTQSRIEVEGGSGKACFVRVRTRKTNGQITSAIYGKIYGGLELTMYGEVRFIYYLNPTPNSRNLEWNRKEDLIPKLKPSAWPDAP